MSAAPQHDVARTSTLLSPEDLSSRWQGLPTVATLRNWRSLGFGPDYFVMSPYRARRPIYPLRAVQAFELEHSCIRRSRPWSGRFLTVEQLIERWHGTSEQVTEGALARWRSPGYRQRACERDRRWLPYLTVHSRQILYPIEAVRAFEEAQVWDRMHRQRAELVMPPVSPTYLELWKNGPPTDDL